MTSASAIPDMASNRKCKRQAKMDDSQCDSTIQSEATAESSPEVLQSDPLKESKIKRKAESPSDFLHGELSEFEELMQAKPPANGISAKEQEKRGRGKLIIFIEVGA
ncbi:hypothetical protein PC129_g430 [Phytophthora cactorum]|uniref:Uncharacterized protein n=1 Tax=Phytophthora cactorum TaxID=29920 RepID=A0A8T1IZ34_9STRA|nr:hypothetical protein Pcac1_g3733 [Phytophthora cactorum]KAG2847693.1 hypothetical protein PC112_g993 [Phytophthora cactorum]KAG2933681.1 hypothetical protein PC114_g1360 [Phytophthora cactorum]KAG2943581.1 hypothetical protein PC115_g754 [Phytophthora cactorum]KAG2997422.1 hypothetical protein PC118_g1938 [Phytophthora cactorum]